MEAGADGCALTAGAGVPALTAVSCMKEATSIPWRYAPLFYHPSFAELNRFQEILKRGLLFADEFSGTSHLEEKRLIAALQDGADDAIAFGWRVWPSNIYKSSLGVANRHFRQGLDLVGRQGFQLKLIAPAVDILFKRAPCGRDCDFCIAFLVAGHKRQNRELARRSLVPPLRKLVFERFILS